jgi:uroporphyrinogen-III synthase
MGRRDEFIHSLDQRMVIARSPKPARVLRQHNIHIDIMPPEPFTSEDLLDAVKEIDLRDRELAVQAYGSPNGFLTQGLSQLGARVREVTLYHWGLPEDFGPVVQMIDDLGQGKIDAVAFTSQPQPGNLVAIAAQCSREDALRKGLNAPSVVVASVGPVCSRGLSRAGIKVDLEPDHPHMGNLVQALALYLEQHSVAAGGSG